jgi:transposase
MAGLIDRREDLVGQRTATVNRLVWRIHELDPARSPGILNYPKHRTALREWLAGQPTIVAELALQELADITRSPTTSTPWSTASPTGCAS